MVKNAGCFACDMERGRDQLLYKTLVLEIQHLVVTVTVFSLATQTWAQPAQPLSVPGCLSSSFTLGKQS